MVAVVCMHVCPPNSFVFMDPMHGDKYRMVGPLWSLFCTRDEHHSDQATHNNESGDILRRRIVRAVPKYFLWHTCACHCADPCAVHVRWSRRAARVDTLAIYVVLSLLHVLELKIL